MIVPNLQKDRILEFLDAGKRFDGRSPEEHRELKIELGISKNAESSCSVKLGKTEVYAGVKLEVVTPYPDSPADGTFMTTMELAPMASEDYELGPPKIDAIEMGRVIDRGIRESGLIEFDKLCIKEGEKVWQIFVDLYAVNDDGNMMDAAAIAALVALGNARLPVYNEETGRTEHELSKTPLPLNKDALSFNVTFHKIGEHVIVDPTMEEEIISDARLSIAIGDGHGKARITAMQKGKEGRLTDDAMEKILSLVELKYSEMLPIIRKHVFK